jgi:putative ABC transport system permease protein
MQRRPGRTLLTLLGIVIGVAAAVAISLTLQTTRRAHHDMFENLTGRAALEVVAPGLGGFNPEKVEFIARLSEVKNAVPAIQTPTGLVKAEGALSALALAQTGRAIPAMALGVDPRRDGAARDYVLRKDQGRLLEADGKGGATAEVLLEAGFAQSNGFSLGRPVGLLTPTGFHQLRVVGLLEPRGAAAFNGGAVVVMPLATAQRLFGLKDQINSYQLVLAEGADPDKVEEKVRQLLPEGLAVQAPRVRGTLGRGLMGPSEQGLASLSVSSLVAGAFVILNAFLMNLGERRRQLAILRALGATRAQVTRLLLREAVLLGGAGTVLGIAAGLALSISLRQVMGQIMAVTLPELRWSAEPFLLAVLLGPGMALAATYLPARRAGRRAPLEDLLPRRGDHSEPLRRWPGYVGLAFLGLTGLWVVGLQRGWLSGAVFFPFIAPAMGVFLVGCVLVVPLMLTPLLRLAGWLLKPLLGLEGRLAVRQVSRQQGRTALTVGVLLIAVVFALGLGQSLRNNLRDINRWIMRVAQGDFIIRGTWPDSTTMISTTALRETLATDLGRLDPHIERVDKFSYIPTRAGSETIVVLAYTYSAGRPLPLQLAEGEPDAVLRGLLRGEAVLGTALGQKLGLGAGDQVTVQTPHGPRTLAIAGTATEYTGGGLAVYLEWDRARELFDMAGVHTFLITARPGKAAAVEPALKAFCDRRGFLFQSNVEVRDMLDRQMAGFLGFVWVLMALVFVVASLGIVNTLTMNVLEQTRELGALRAMGMKQGQVRKMVLSQALALGVISLVPGVVGGIGLAVMINVTTYPLMGQPVPFHLDAWLVAGCFVAALAIALLAALVPARRAARLKVIEALQYE